MRTRLMGLVAGVALTTAVASLTAAPAYATTYTVKTIYQTQTEDGGCSGPALDFAQGTHGSVTFARGTTTMAATVHLANAASNHTTYQAHLASTTGSGPGDTCGSGVFKNFTTNGSGSATVFLGPVKLDASPYSGTGSGYKVRSFWVLITEGYGTPVFSTDRVLAHGH